MDCRLGAPNFDIAASAGWYSAIAGVLAGFALLAILLPLDHESREDAGDRGADAVVIFTCAFFSLLILSISYAVLAGRTGDGPDVGIAAHEQLLNGAAFGLSSLLLLFALHAVLGTYGANRRVFESSQSVILGATGVIGPVVLISLQFANALDLERYRLALVRDATAECGRWGLPTGVWINLGITMAALLAVIVLAAFRHRVPRVGSAPQWVAKAALVLTALTVVWTSIVLPLLAVDVATSAVFEHVALSAGAVATVAVAAASWLGR